MPTPPSFGASGTSETMSPSPYPAEKARQGEIILEHRWSRVVFFTGLFGGFVLLAVVAILLGIFR